MKKYLSYGVGTVGFIALFLGIWFLTNLYWNNKIDSRIKMVFGSGFSVARNFNPTASSSLPFVAGSVTTTNLAVLNLANLLKLGANTSSPVAQLAVAGLGNGSGLTFALLNGTGTTTFKVADSGHISSSGTTPVLSGALPATPTIIGNDNAFVITAAGATSTLVLTFNTAWVNAPSCVLRMVTSSLNNIMKYTVSASAITLSTTTGSGIVGLTGSTIYGNCVGISE